MLVVHAMSVCKLVSALRLEFTRELQVIINVLLFSEVIVVVGREHRERAYCSVLGWGWEVGDVWLCIHCVIYKGNCNVLYCCVGENVCIFSIKHSGFWGKKNAQGIMGQEIVDSCKRWLPSLLGRKTRDPGWLRFTAFAKACVKGHLVDFSCVFILCIQSSFFSWEQCLRPNSGKRLSSMPLGIMNNCQ